MALEGSIISWVTTHRRHHMFSDRPGDPHSPVSYGTENPTATRGFLWAHVGWLFASDPTSQQRFAPDLLRDPDLVTIDRLFPVLAVFSLVLPLVIGWAVTGTLGGALGVFLWAGLIRMALLHHVTWSINSVCHLWGRRPFTTGDHSANVASLALVSFGESWHNFHHAAPASARHGVLAHQVDLAAGLIRMFERAGWVTKVRWPTDDADRNADHSRRGTPPNLTLSPGRAIGNGSPLSEMPRRGPRPPRPASRRRRSGRRSVGVSRW